MQHPYSHLASSFLTKAFPSRFKLIEGDVFDVLHTRHNHTAFVFVDAHALQDGRQAFGKNKNGFDTCRQSKQL